MGPKKPKKTKAELEEERVAREEEERKAKALEEKRSAEDREKKRQEELRLAAEQKSFREKELQRLTEEYAEIVDELRDREQQLKAEEKLEESRLEWIGYKNPTDEPDATIEKDMNTFITLTREAQVQEIKEAIEWIKKIEKVSLAVEDVWSDSLARNDEAMKEKSYKNIVVLREMILEKIDQATIPLVRFADRYLNDRQELNIEEVATNVGIGIWASYNDIRPIRKSVQLEQLGIQVDIPKQLLQQNERFVYRLLRVPLVSYNFEAYRLSQTPSLNVFEDEEIKKAFAARAKYVVGDIIHFDMLHSPSSAHHIRAKKWVLRDSSQHSNAIRKAVYPSSVACRMFLKIPETVLLSDDLRIAVWDDHAKDWVEDGITDYQYSESTRIVQFYITTVGMIALVKRRYSDMPLKSWSLFPVLTKPIHEYMQFTANNTLGSSAISLTELEKQGYLRNTTSSMVVSNTPITFEKHARLVLTTQTLTALTIDIIDAKCYFISPTTPVFQDLLGKPFSPGCLLKRLQRKGINLLPILTDFHLNADCKLRNEVLEREVLQQLASVANALDITSCADWNKSQNESQVGLFVRESCVYTCPGEENEYECVLVERDEISIMYQNTPELGLAPGPDGIQYTLVYGNEYGKRTLFSNAPRSNEAVHLELSRALTQRITPDAMDRIKRINPRFQKTIYTLLSLIRLYSQS